MGDDAATVEQLRAELAGARQREATLVAENGVLCDVNAALAAERSEALEQQAATDEILRVIASSPTDLAELLQAVGERAQKLLDAAGVFVYLVEGIDVVRVAGFGAVGHAEANLKRPLDRTWTGGRAVLDRRTVHVHDAAALPEAEYPLTRAIQRRFGYRTGV